MVGVSSMIRILGYGLGSWLWRMIIQMLEDSQDTAVLCKAYGRVDGKGREAMISLITSSHVTCSSNKFLITPDLT